MGQAISITKQRGRTLMNLDHVSQALSGSKAQTLLKELYTEAGAVTNQERYLHVAEGFCRVFGQKDFEFFTSPAVRRSAGITRITITERS